MALISILQALAVPLLGLPAAAIVERSSKRRAMVLMDLGRMLALCAIPALYLAHHLNVGALAVCATLVAAMSCVHDVAYQASLPAVIEPDQLLGGNAKLEMSNGAAMSIGPSVGGLLSQGAGAPFAMLLDAASYLVSAATIARMKPFAVPTPALARGPAPGAGVWEALKLVLADSALRRLVLSTGTLNCALGIGQIANMLFLYRVLHLSPLAIGIILAVANVGSFGVVFAVKLGERVGTVPMLVAAVALASLCRLVFACAPSAAPVLVAIPALTGLSFALSLYNVVQLSFRQAAVPPELRARAHAAMRALNSASMPFGALIGAALVSSLGLRPTIALVGIVTSLAIVWFVPRPWSNRPARVHALSGGS